jgi:hypothetical protein
VVVRASTNTSRDSIFGLIHRTGSSAYLCFLMTQPNHAWAKATSEEAMDLVESARQFTETTKRLVCFSKKKIWLHIEHTAALYKLVVKSASDPNCPFAKYVTEQSINSMQVEVGRQARRGSFLVRRRLHYFRVQLSFQERNTRAKLNSECFWENKNIVAVPKPQKLKSFFSIKKYRYHSLLQTEGRIKENKTECTKDWPALPLYIKIITLSTKKNRTGR